MASCSAASQRRLQLCCHALAAAMCCSSPAATAAVLPHPRGDRHHADHDTIVGLEKRWRAALMQGDAAALDHMLADDFMSISANGTLADKQSYLAEITSHRLVFTRLDLRERKVRVQESSAIVTSLAAVEGRMDRVPITGIFRYTRVYSRSSAGGWKIVNFEATRVSGGVGQQPDLRNGVPVAPGEQGAQPQ